MRTGLFPSSPGVVSRATADQTASGGSDAGFSLLESLISLTLILVITGSVFALVNPATETSQTQPEAMDMQQRGRISADLLARDMFMAGAGVYSGPQVGALMNYFAPVIPRKMGLNGADDWTVVRPDAITLMYVPNSYSQTTIRDPMPQPSAELKVEDMANCPKLQELCGFKIGDTLMILDTAGHFDFFTVTNVQNSAGHLQHRQTSLSYAYQPGAYVTQAETHTYYLDAANNTLRHYDGYLTDVAVVENVVGLTFSYFGDPNPPISPKPPPGVANCLYDAAGNPARDCRCCPPRADRSRRCRWPCSTTARGAATATTASTPTCCASAGSARTSACRPPTRPSAARTRSSASRERAAAPSATCRTTCCRSTSRRATSTSGDDTYGVPSRSRATTIR